MPTWGISAASRSASRGCTSPFPAWCSTISGQSALLLDDPSAIDNPFFRMAPDWARLPLVALATMATVIASQAVISGAFSVTQQAIQLGFLPRLRITHTSAKAAGQIYVPLVNWLLLGFVLLLVLGFRSSGNLASAYGIAVTGTMFITSCMLAVLLFTIWNWNRWAAGLMVGSFLIVDGAYFASNITKIPDGGWFPLLVGACAFTILTTWSTGRRLMRERLFENAMPLELFIESAMKSVKRVPGTAVFLSASPEGAPPALLHNLKHNKVLHERIVILTVKIMGRPVVDETDRVHVTELAHDFFRIVLRYGFMQEIDIPAALAITPQMRAAVQADGDELLPRPPDADRVRAARHGDLARKGVRLDDAQRRKRDGVLQAAAQPRGRAGQPARDLSGASDRQDGTRYEPVPVWLRSQLRRRRLDRHPALHRRPRSELRHPARDAVLARQRLGEHVLHHRRRAHHPWIAGDVGDRVVVARQIARLAQPPVEHAEQPRRFLGEAIDRERRLFLRAHREEAELPQHRPERADLPIEPLHRLPPRMPRWREEAAPCLSARYSRIAPLSKIDSGPPSAP